MNCLFKDKVSSHPSPFSVLGVSIKTRFWKLADRYKCAHPIGEIFPTPSISLCSGGGGEGWIADYGVDYEIR
jgi:hypothetical protein